MGLAPFHDFEDQVDDDLKAEVDELKRQQIIAGEIVGGVLAGALA